jgi:DNA-binding NtrC family response regulator
MGREPMTLSPTVRQIFRTHPWRGNVRELKNTIERAVIFGSQAVLDNSLLPPQMISSAGLPPVDTGICAAIPENLDLDRQVALFERQVILKALERTDGNKSRAAAELGISRFSLNRRMERFSRLMRQPVDSGETAS